VDRITLDSIDLQCIVGILPSERVEPQRMQLALSLDLDLQACAETGDLAHSVDYAVVSKAARFLAGRGRFWLIESLGLAICRVVLAEPGPGQGSAQVQGCRVHIRKPDILGGEAIPGVEVTRNAPLTLHEDRLDGCRIQRLVDTGRDAAWRVLLPDGASYAQVEGTDCTPLWGEVACSGGAWRATDGPAGLLVVKTD